MRILVTGKGTSGSWLIRGEQLGEAIGATVFPKAEMAEIKQADLVVVVKRTPVELISKIRAAGKPWVLDFVDGWPQPSGNEWPKVQAVNWLQAHFRTLRPSGIVFATSQMRTDSGQDGLVLPHHAWAKYRRKTVSGCVKRVGYEGAPEYLGRWRGIVERECQKRGWEFVINGDLSSCDMGVALRDVGGYPCGAWKANTKLANLQALGIPALVSPEESYREFSDGCTHTVRTEKDLSEGMDALSDYAVRVEISENANPPLLENVAKDYREWLARLKF